MQWFASVSPVPWDVIGRGGGPGVEEAPDPFPCQEVELTSSEPEGRARELLGHVDILPVSLGLGV